MSADVFEKLDKVKEIQTDDCPYDLIKSRIFRVLADDAAFEDMLKIYLEAPGAKYADAFRKEVDLGFKAAYFQSYGEFGNYN
ncbi:MAG: hypothetical protein LBN08_00700 [Lactobacillales bacterium]|jgi:hypothetical protein|nr:hypothetical protein [Lactobacillales bacterium]